ncbi:MAG TPA: hypothetical protein VGM87_08895 [Roseomonas sp.]|jgi:hypothetical protein
MRDVVFGVIVGAGLIMGTLAIDAVLRSGAAERQIFHLAAFD